MYGWVGTFVFWYVIVLAGIIFYMFNMKIEKHVIIKTGIAGIVLGGIVIFTSNTNYQNQQKENLATYELGYEKGWSEGCSFVMNYFYNKDIMYAGDNAYTTEWCNSLYYYDSSSYEDNIYYFEEDYSYYYDKGKIIGMNKAVDEIFKYTDYLCYGEDCLDKSYLIERSGNSYSNDNLY